MTNPSLIIIGAGIAGLSAGCYAQMNGLNSRIFERHSIPGGLCTSWRRGEYIFDGAIRYLSGIGPRNPNPMWHELGMLRERQIYYHHEFICYEGADGRALHLYTNIDRLEAHLLELAPQDEGPIRELTAALRQFTRLDLPVDLTPSDALEALQLGQEFLPMLGPLLRWRDVTVREFAARFKDPLLREALPQFMQFARPDFPMMLLLTTLAMMNDREAGYPIGGSLRFAEDLAQRYCDLGGEVHYGARVDKVLVENGHAVGVRLADGSEQRADLVISAADGHATIFDLLDGRYVNETILSYYRDLPLAQSILQISLGVAANFSDEPATLSFPLKQPILLGNLRHDRLVLKHYCFDPTLAPADKSVLSVWCEADYDYWAALRADRARYRAAKREAAERVVTALEERYPRLRGRVEEVDVATPVTYERYTGNWRGAFAGWAITTRKMSMMMGRAMSKTLPGLRNFYMIGQWVEPGGNVELSAASGRDVIKDICRAAGRPFRTAPA